MNGGADRRAFIAALALLPFASRAQGPRVFD
jgi:hypothetical protein